MGNSERGKAESLVGGERSRYFYGFICGRGRDPGWSQRPYHLHEWTEGEKVDRRHGCETPNIAWIFELNGNGETVCASFFFSSESKLGTEKGSAGSPLYTWTLHPQDEYTRVLLPDLVQCP